MKEKLTINRKAFTLLQLVFLYAWAANLSGTDSYYSVYVICALAGAYCLVDNGRTDTVIQRKGNLWIPFLAGVSFGLATLLANYRLFIPLKLINLFEFGCAFLGGVVIGYNVMVWLFEKLPLKIGPVGEHPERLFFLVFASVMLIDMCYLFFSDYPGVLTADSILTLKRIIRGTRENTMPYWHTQLSGVLFRLGSWLGGSANAGCACIHIFQSMFMAMCFGYAVVTLYQMGIPRALVWIAWGLYALLPYNIVYASTLWKDVPFGGAVLLMVTALCRLLRGVGKIRWINYICYALGALGLGLLRTNGIYALTVTILILTIVMWKAEKRVLVGLGAGVLGICLILTGPVLSLLQVEPTNKIEALGVPFQQVARLIALDREIDDEDCALLEEVVDLNRVKELYDPRTVDPVKFNCFRWDRQDYFNTHARQYLSLYVRLGLRYPGGYLAAWIDETRGFWNGGYSFWIYTYGVEQNAFGIESTVGRNPVKSAFNLWFRLVEAPTELEFLFSIGFHVWLLFGCALLNLWKRRSEGLLTVPLIILIVGLWAATPVFAEFRYAYPVFTSLPIIMGATVYEKA